MNLPGPLLETNKSDGGNKRVKLRGPCFFCMMTEQ